MHLILFLLTLQNRDNGLYIKRWFEISANKINNKLPCVYCKGGGYLSCKCKHGCWRCSDSTLSKCSFCSGNGKGRYEYVKIEI